MLTSAFNLRLRPRRINIIVTHIKADTINKTANYWHATRNFTNYSHATRLLALTPNATLLLALTPHATLLLALTPHATLLLALILCT
jgi:hypothetical protein